MAPGRALLQETVGVETGDLGARAGSARRAVVLSTRTEDEVAAVRVRSLRRAEEFDVVDLLTPLARDAVGGERATDRLRVLQEGRDLLRLQPAGAHVDQEEPVPAPGDVADDRSVPRDLHRDFRAIPVARNVRDRNVVRSMERGAHGSHRRFHDLRSHRWDLPEVGERNEKADRSVTAHAEVADVVEEHDRVRARPFRGQPQATDQFGRAAGRADHETAQIVVFASEPVAPLGDGPPAEIRSPRDDDARWFPLGVTIYEAQPVARPRWIRARHDLPGRRVSVDAPPTERASMSLRVRGRRGRAVGRGYTSTAAVRPTMTEGIPEGGRGQLFIGGEWLPPTGGAYRPVVDPSTGRSIAEAPRATVEDARAAVDAAARVEERWGGVPGHERAAILRRTALRIRADREVMAHLISIEVGKPIGQARAEVDRAAGVFDLAAEEIRHLGGETFPADAYEQPAGNETRFLFTVRDPMGVVVAIGPFNFPLNLLVHKVAPALAVGNPIVVKPTSNAPFTASRLATHLAAAGLPAGALNIVVGPGGVVGDALIEHPATRLVTFTGSTEVGKHIAGIAGAHAKRVMLEMGGMDPVVVLEDADLGAAVAAAARGAFLYSGQVCTASKRLLVQDAVADRFATALAERARALRVGPALDEATEVGPVIDESALERLESMVSAARRDSAKVLTGGGRPATRSEGFYFEPTVLDEVPEGARVLHEEPFGPIAPIVRFSAIDDAVRIANSTPYGLQAAVYTSRLSRAFAIAKRIRAGGVHLNDPTNIRWDALPFGGVKESGLGREGLRWAMQEMTEVKLISVNYGGV